MIYRELTRDEFHLAPREVDGSEVFTPDNSRILAAFNDDGEVVSTWVLFSVVHLEPFWIRDDYRGSKSATIIKNMTKEMGSMLSRSGIKNAYTIVLESVHVKVLTRLAEWFGFRRIYGSLFLWESK